MPGPVSHRGITMRRPLGRSTPQARSRHQLPRPRLCGRSSCTRPPRMSFTPAPAWAIVLIAVTAIVAGVSLA
jgi:hypothetical protein